MQLVRQIANLFGRPVRQRAGRPFRFPRHARGVFRARQKLTTPRVKWRGFFRRTTRVLKNGFRPRLRHGRVIAFHGTPSAANAKSILRHGFMTGGGNALGDGVYLTTDLNAAKGYASGGVYLKCLVTLGRTCVWGSPMQARYGAWCQSRGVRQDNSAMTAFLLQHGYKTLQSGNVVVVLSPQFANPSAWKRKSGLIRVLSIHRASDGARIDV